MSKVSKIMDLSMSDIALTAEKFAPVTFSDVVGPMSDTAVRFDPVTFSDMVELKTDVIKTVVNFTGDLSFELAPFEDLVACPDSTVLSSDCVVTSPKIVVT